jgi:ribosomal protein S18 acetylase RimI-like enzyme
MACLPVYSLRQATNNDFDFLYQLHVAAMREYVEATWGWQEEWQQEYFARKFDPHNRQIIRIDGQDAGVIVIEPRIEELYIALIEILPAFQRRGIGTAIVRQLINTADSDGLPVSLHVLKTNNPARQLYERLGFISVQDEGIRYKMTRPL